MNNLSKPQSEAVKELKFRNLGCCGGDNCPNYEPIRDNDGNSTASNHDEALEQFIADQIQKAVEETRKEDIKLSDKIELENQTVFDEWKAFKQFRNTLRDLSIQSKMKIK